MSEPSMAVVLRLDSAEPPRFVIDILQRLEARSAAAERLLQALLDRPQLLFELRQVDGYVAPAAGANELLFTLAPSHRARRLAAALGAGDGELDAIEIELRHLSDSSEGVIFRPTEDGESPGGTNAGPPGDGVAS